MILQALKEYYDRKASDPEDGIAPEGFELKELPFLIVIDQDGRFVNLEDTREPFGKKLIGKKYLLPLSKPRAGSRSYATTFLLWDHIGYVLGLPTEDEKSEKQHRTWLDALTQLPDSLKQDDGVKAILQFYDTKQLQVAITSPEIANCLRNPSCNMSFRLVSDLHPVACREKVKEHVREQINSGPSADDEDAGGGPARRGICLITGEEGEIARIHHRTPIDKDTKSLVGIQRSSGYDSYGKEQGYNAPIINSTEFAYVTALNTLLKSKQRIQVGDAATVFWSHRESNFESDFSSFFSEPEKDDPDAGTNKIRALYNSANSGAYQEDQSKDKFYILGLSPNSARISVRFWKVGTISEFAEKIRQYFDDFTIVKPPKEQEFYSIWRILVNVSTLDKSENIPPNLAGEFMRSILNGTPYPATLLQAALRRIRSDTEFRVKPVRAALIKAYLNRYYRYYPSKDFKEISMELDTNQTSTGYQLGRLFATLEKIQEEANPGLNATIRERYYGAACATPVTVFPNLLRLKNHHLAKLDNKGRVVTFEKLLGDILGNLSDFPSHLNMHQQGLFAIGYYHQKQNFYTAKNS